jgi:hypothetical protein
VKEIAVKIFDDLDFHESGARHEACVTLSIGLNGTWRELDLTEANEKEVRDTLDRLMAAGHEPDRVPVPAAVRHGHNPAVSARNEKIRAWCRETGLMNSTGTGYAFQTNSSQMDYIGRPLIRKYEAYLAEQAAARKDAR